MNPPPPPPQFRLKKNRVKKRRPHAIKAVHTNADIRSPPPLRAPLNTNDVKQTNQQTAIVKVAVASKHKPDEDDQEKRKIPALLHQQQSVAPRPVPLPAPTSIIRQEISQDTKAAMNPNDPT